MLLSPNQSELFIEIYKYYPVVWASTGLWYSIAARLPLWHYRCKARKIELKSYRRMFQAVQQVFFDDAIGHHPSGQEHMAATCTG